MENMKIYELARVVPNEARKPIQAGRLKGMTDVNPMWRIKRLTEMFGPCGVGWWYTITDKQIIDDELTHQRAAFVDIDLFFVDPETGTPSHAIPGTGGASFVTQERSGAYLSDECFKMALTDAISVAAKALGVAADVYFEKDRTKYNAVEVRSDLSEAQPKEEPKKEEPIICEQCGKPVLPYTSKRTGEMISAAKHAAHSKKQFDGKVICLACIEQNKKDANDQS